MKPVVFIPEPIAASGLDLLKAECDCLAPWEDGLDSDRSMLQEADAVIVRLFKIDAQDIGQARRLKVISKHGAGVDNIDLQAATAAGIPVLYTPTATVNAVAEHTLALMLALTRQIVPASAALKEGRFHERGRFQGVELAGKTLGVVGLGRIGTRVAQMAALGLGMSVSAYDPFVSKAAYSGLETIEDSLEALFRKADILTLHVPLTPETRHMINNHSLAWAKPGCRLVNTSRGAVIDEAALFRALTEGQLAGAALDVFEQEPLPPDHPLCQAPNTLLTPHISSSTQESLERMSLQAAQGVLDVLHSRIPEHLVNPDYLDSDNYGSS
jgi:D-3-phosphoglycerate dehydrogenase